MRNKNRSRKYLIILLIILIFLGIPSYLWTRKNVNALAGRYNSTMSPIIMIPGSSATADRLDGMISAVNQDFDEHHNVLKVTVHTNDKITYRGHIRASDNRPFIVVGFQNSQDGFANIKKQVIWFNLAFNALRQKYRFNNFNAFGHSNGSLIWTYFLEDHFSDSDIKINHLMTIGAPYNFEETNSANHTEMLNQLIDHRKNIPTNLSYYSIAGTKVYADDGVVPIESVDAGKYIYEGQIKHYTLITLTGSNAEHSDMLTNTQFINLFHQYIINNGKSPTTKNRNS